MSTVKFDTWRNSNNSQNGKIRARVNFNGTGTLAIRASTNVSSVTDNGTGDYVANFTAAMPDANYSIVGNARGASAAAFLNPYDNATPRTVNAARIATFVWNGVNMVDTDLAFIDVAFID